MRTAQVPLPRDISGLMLTDSTIGLFVVANQGHVYLRRRFSFAHEGTVTSSWIAIGRHDQPLGDREVSSKWRANAFAAAFLMPREGVEDFLARLAERATEPALEPRFTTARRPSTTSRPEAGSQAIQFHDVVLLAHQFGVSRQSALYRLKNLKQISEAEFSDLWSLDEQGVGKELASLMKLHNPDDSGARTTSSATISWPRL
ncbi:MAG: ImmA/IrrE family metallo-endopeptidase [Thermoanaerobaculia bacterium]